MDIAAEISAALGPDWLPAIYRDKIRSQRTRSIRIEVPPRENTALIQHTLLGIELKVGKHRFACPELATARYMCVFARIGCAEFAIPYDITKISPAADELETAWQHSILVLEAKLSGKTSRSVSLARAKLAVAMRSEIAETGPGATMPKFERETRQRKD